jgi:hypothetical protein
MIKEKLQSSLKEKLRKILTQIRNVEYKDKQEMDDLTFEREKIIFALEVLKEFDKEIK